QTPEHAATPEDTQLKNSRLRPPATLRDHGMRSHMPGFRARLYVARRVSRGFSRWVQGVVATLLADSLSSVTISGGGGAVARGGRGQAFGFAASGQDGRRCCFLVRFSYQGPALLFRSRFD